MNHPLPSASSVEPVKFWLHRAIDVFEASDNLHNPRSRRPSVSPRLAGSLLVVQRELEEMQESGEDKAADAQVALAAECAVTRELPVVLCCCRRTPLTTVIRLIAVESRIPWRRLVAERFEDRDFPRATVAIGKLAMSRLAIFDGRDARSFALEFEQLAFHWEPRLAILDWEPARWQWVGLQELCRRHNLTFVQRAEGA